MQSVCRTLSEAKERNVLVEINLKGKRMVGKVEKLDQEHEVAFIKHFGRINRVPLHNIEKVSYPATHMLKGTEEIDIRIKCVTECIERVIDIYESSDGHPTDETTVNCPNCETPTTSFSCAWFVNQHVHFRCPECDFGFMQ